VITVLATGVDRHELAEMHRPILEALAAGAPDEAGRAVREHVEHFGRLLRHGRRA
jgi:DNA-binding FadR family transcriptional regulator